MLVQATLVSALLALASAADYRLDLTTTKTAGLTCKKWEQVCTYVVKAALPAVKAPKVSQVCEYEQKEDHTAKAFCRYNNKDYTKAAAKRINASVGPAPAPPASPVFVEFKKPQTLQKYCKKFVDNCYDTCWNVFEDQVDEQTKYECGVVPRYPLRAEVSCACVYKGRLDVTAKVIKRTGGKVVQM